MKALCFLFLAMVMLPYSLLAGREHEEIIFGEHSMNVTPIGIPQVSVSHLPEMERIPPQEQSSPVSTLDVRDVPTKVKLSNSSKTTISPQAKPHRLAWARTGTIILLISGAVFFLGLIFLLVGIASFYGVGLIVLGEIFMLMAVIGLSIGLVIGAIG